MFQVALTIISEEVIMERRLVGIDLLKILSALIVFLFHNNIHLNARFGFFTPFIANGAVFMTLFFVMSGAILYYLYIGINNTDFLNIKKLKNFYIRRIISIIPLYYAVTIIYLIVNKSFSIETLVLFPVEILCIQSTFVSIFDKFHNGGTWFVSNIVICYFLFPFFANIINKLYVKTKITSLCTIFFIVGYSEFIIYKFGLTFQYSSVWLRTLEFFCGVLIADVFIHLDNKKFSRLFTLKAFTIEFIIIFLTITIIHKCKFVRWNFTFYDILMLPLFSLMVFSMLGIRNKILSSSKIFNYSSSLAYAFFLSQFFGVKNTEWISKNFDFSPCYGGLLVSFVCCLTISILLHELIEKPIGKFLKKKLVHSS